MGKKIQLRPGYKFRKVNTRLYDGNDKLKWIWAEATDEFILRAASGTNYLIHIIHAGNCNNAEASVISEDDAAKYETCPPEELRDLYKASVTVVSLDPDEYEESRPTLLDVIRAIYKREDEAAVR